jgi:hypothetical protein
MAPHVRTVTTPSGARGVQIVHSKRGGKRDLEYVGSAHTDAEYEALLEAARQKIARNQPELDLGLAVPRAAPTAVITASRLGVLWELLEIAYARLGFITVPQDVDGDVFRRLVLARILEPTSKLDAIRVLDEAGIPAPSYATLKRRLPGYATDQFRDRLAKALAVHAALGPATLVLYDVTTLYFETDQGDGFRESGFSKERRLEPQITVGLLTDQSGFPLTIQAFEGNKAETATMLPTLRAFMAAHDLADVTVVADAGMVSEANKHAIEQAGLGFILGAKTPQVPYVIQRWRDEHPGEPIPDGHVFTQPRPAGPAGSRRDEVFYYRYSADNARRTLKGIDEQIRKAEAAVAGKVSVKRNRFVKLTDATKTVNRDLEAKARALAGIKAYVTNLVDQPPEFIIGAYHRLYQIEKSFRMSKSDLRARPIYHHVRESIDAHLTIVLAALAVSRWLEDTTGWSIRRVVKTLRRYRHIEITLGGQTIAAAEPLPDDTAALIDEIRHPKPGAPR